MGELILLQATGWAGGEGRFAKAGQSPPGSGRRLGFSFQRLSVSAFCFLSAAGGNWFCVNSENWHLLGDKATMQRVVLEGFAESTSVLRERPDREYGG